MKRYHYILVAAVFTSTLFSYSNIFAETTPYIEVERSSLDDIVVNSETNFIYVMTPDSSGPRFDGIYVIDGSNNEITQKIEFDRMPRTLAVNPLTNLVYAARMSEVQSYQSVIEVIDGYSNEIKSSIIVEDSAKDIAINPNTNMVYVVNYWSGSLSVIDGSKNQLVTNIKVGGSNPTGVTVNPNSNLIYVAITDVFKSYSENKIDVIDGSSNKIIQSITLDDRPEGILVNPNTNLIYLANMGNNFKQGSSLIVIDGESNEVVKEFNIEFPLRLDFNPNTNQIFVLSSDNIITIIDGNTNEVTETIGLLDIKDVAVNPTTNLIYVSTEKSGIGIIDGSTNALVEFEKPEPFPSTPLEEFTFYVMAIGWMLSGTIVLAATLIGLAFASNYIKNRKLSTKDEPKEKVNIKSQLFLAGIPAFITPFIAFYKINKILKGGLLLVGIYSSSLLIPMLVVSTSYTSSFSNYVLQISVLSMILIPIVSPLYFVWKWSRQYNENIDKFGEVQSPKLVEELESNQQFLIKKPSKWIKPDLFLKIAGIILICLSSILVVGIIHSYLSIPEYNDQTVYDSSFLGTLIGLGFLYIFMFGGIAFQSGFGFVASILLFKKRKIGLFLAIISVVFLFASFIPGEKEVTSTVLIRLLNIDAETLAIVFYPILISVIALLILANGKVDWHKNAIKTKV